VQFRIQLVRFKVSVGPGTHCFVLVRRFSLPRP
jgi:hypothetical protein